MRLSPRNFHTNDACHRSLNALTLPLLVAGVRANHADDAFAPHDLAVLTYFLD